jgi:hypothetical protein
MVAKITTGSDIYGALAYNQEKVNAVKGEVLANPSSQCIASKRWVSSEHCYRYTT